MTRLWGRLFGAGNVSTPLTMITETVKPTLKVLNPVSNSFVPSVDFDKKIVTLKRPFPNEIKISSPMGERVINGAREFHFGYDFKTPVGTEVTACVDGSVFRIGQQDEFSLKVGFGLRVWQEAEIGGKRFYVFYAHLSEILVGQGEDIKFGQVIALTGNTGRTTGPHCHIECRLKNTSERYWINFV